MPVVFKSQMQDAFPLGPHVCKTDLETGRQMSGNKGADRRR